MAEKLLEVKNLRTEFKRDKTWVTAVNNVSFSIQPGEILGLVGESGCGKSVTAKSIIGLNPSKPKGLLKKGEIWFDGKDLAKLKEKEMQKIEKQDLQQSFLTPEYLFRKHASY